MPDTSYNAANVERFKGFAGQYDNYRPAPPSALIDILTQLARTPRPDYVVDIGSGTGLSTRIWADRAEAVIGIEPNDEMRSKAEERSAGLANVRYLDGDSTATTLPDGCADIVTVSQALHWMEPAGTFAEVARLLRPGGVFAAIDNDLVPIIDWEAQIAIRTFSARINQLLAERNADAEIMRWPKSEHLQRITESGRFRYTQEFCLHHVEQGNADRVVGIAYTLGTLQTLFKLGVTDEELGFPAFRAQAKRILGDELKPWYFTCRVRIGIK